MSTEETPQDVAPSSPTAEKAPPTEPAAMAATTSKARPKLDLSDTKPGERRRGKTMFGLVLGTLNKAKIEDKERNASDAAKKRQMIEHRLQIKLRKETDSVRRAEEAKKDKTAANRKEEDLQLKDSIYKLRRTRLPLLANFLCTSDVISDLPASEDLSPSAPGYTDPLAPVPRSHPPPLYYLPAILTPAQEAFIKKRKELVTEASQKEWSLFLEERTVGITEIHQLRQRVADEEAHKKSGADAEGVDAEMEAEPSSASNGTNKKAEAGVGEGEAMAMDVDESGPAKPAREGSSSTTEKVGVSSTATEKKDSVDDDDAVEY